MVRYQPLLSLDVIVSEISCSFQAPRKRKMQNHGVACIVVDSVEIVVILFDCWWSLSPHSTPPSASMRLLEVEPRTVRQAFLRHHSLPPATNPAYRGNTRGERACFQVPTRQSYSNVAALMVSTYCINSNDHVAKQRCVAFSVDRSGRSATSCCSSTRLGL